MTSLFTFLMYHGLLTEKRYISPPFPSIHNWLLTTHTEKLRVTWGETRSLLQFLTTNLKVWEKSVCTHDACSSKYRYFNRSIHTWNSPLLDNYVKRVFMAIMVILRKEWHTNNVAKNRTEYRYRYRVDVYTENIWSMR